MYSMIQLCVYATYALDYSMCLTFLDLLQEGVNEDASRGVIAEYSYSTVQVRYLRVTWARSAA